MAKSKNGDKNRAPSWKERGGMRAGQNTSEKMTRKNITKNERKHSEREREREKDSRKGRKKLEKTIFQPLIKVSSNADPVVGYIFRLSLWTLWKLRVK